MRLPRTAGEYHAAITARRDRQVVRVLGILKLLAEGARPTVYDLAARFHTRRETIYRDLHGCPVLDDHE